MNPSSSKRLRSSQFCIVAHIEQYDGSNEYKLYIVDPISSPPNDRLIDGYIKAAPTIRYTRASRAMAFCAVDSIIYVFEGDWGVTGSRSAPTQGSASKMELSVQFLLAAGANYEVTKDELVEIPGMHHNKICPIALPTPNGKDILVFSSMIRPESSAFELYNIAGNCWKVLPTLGNRTRMCIEAYGFVGEDRLLIQTKETGMCVLDFKAGMWKKLYHYGGAQEIPCTRLFDHFIGIENGDFLITPLFACDLRDKDGFQFSRRHMFPVPSPEPKFREADEIYERFGQSIALLGYESGVCRVCLLHAEDYDYGDAYVRLHIYACSANVGKYKMLKERVDRSPRGGNEKGDYSTAAVPFDLEVTGSLNLSIDVDAGASIYPVLPVFTISM